MNDKELRSTIISQGLVLIGIIIATIVIIVIGNDFSALLLIAAILSECLLVWHMLYLYEKDKVINCVKKLLGMT